MRESGREGGRFIWEPAMKRKNEPLGFRYGPETSGSGNRDDDGSLLSRRDNGLPALKAFVRGAGFNFQEAAAPR